MSNVNARVGHIIAEVIHEKGMTKRAVSEKSGMPYSTLNSKIKGYRSIDLEDLLVIAEATREPLRRFIPPELLEEKDSALADGVLK